MNAILYVGVQAKARFYYNVHARSPSTWNSPILVPRYICTIQSSARLSAVNCLRVMASAGTPNQIIIFL